MAVWPVSAAILEIFSVKEWHDLEMWVWGPFVILFSVKEWPDLENRVRVRSIKVIGNDTI